MQHPRVTRDTTFPAYGRVLNGDVVTYYRAVTHLCRVKPAVAANVCAVAYDAGLGEAGVTGYPGPGKHHAVFIVNPAIPVPASACSSSTQPPLVPLVTSLKSFTAIICLRGVVHGVDPSCQRQRRVSLLSRYFVIVLSLKSLSINVAKFWFFEVLASAQETP